jgi:hypothetical protein
MTGLAADTATAYGIDTGRDRLVRGAGGNGIVQMVGSLGSNAGSNVGFDVASTGGSWAVLRVGELQRLHRVDLATGHATYVADAPIEPGGSSNVVGAAIVGP